MIQFHDDINGRTEIVLGVFNEIIHKQWIKEVNSGKHILKVSLNKTLTNHLHISRKLFTIGLLLFI